MIQHLHPGGASQFLQLCQRILHFAALATSPNRDQDRPFLTFRRRGFNPQRLVKAAFKVGNEVGAIVSRSFKGLYRQHGDTAWFGAEVGQLHGYPLRVCLGKGGDQVKPQQPQVSQIVFSQRFLFQVGMDQTQATQTFAAQGIVLQVGDQQPFFSADKHQLNSPLAIDQQADLTADIK